MITYAHFKVKLALLGGLTCVLKRDYPPKKHSATFKSSHHNGGTMPIPASCSLGLMSSLNPNLTSSINPHLTSSINPKLTSSINPNISSNISSLYLFNLALNKVGFTVSSTSNYWLSFDMFCSSLTPQCILRRTSSIRLIKIIILLNNLLIPKRKAGSGFM